MANHCRIAAASAQAALNAIVDHWVPTPEA